MNRLLRPALLCSSLLATACETPFSIDGPPEVEVGTGEFEFRAVEPGTELFVVQGDQGGQHLWMGVRVENMNPNDMHLELEIEFAETSEAHGSPLFFDVDLFEGASGQFEFAGLPAQVKASEVDRERLRLQVVAMDKDGREAEDEMEVVALRDE